VRRRLLIGIGKPMASTLDAGDIRFHRMPCGGLILIALPVAPINVAIRSSRNGLFHTRLGCGTCLWYVLGVHVVEFNQRPSCALYEPVGGAVFLAVVSKELQEGSTSLLHGRGRERRIISSQQRNFTGTDELVALDSATVVVADDEFGHVGEQVIEVEIKAFFPAQALPYVCKCHCDWVWVGLVPVHE